MPTPVFHKLCVKHLHEFALETSLAPLHCAHGPPRAPPRQDGVSFSSSLATFYPCFTGILSGANRADSLAVCIKDTRTE